MKISIIIINFNTKSLTEQCIRSVIAETSALFEIIVVDNSTKSEEKFSSNLDCIKVINTENKGFGNACNIGIKAACGDFYLMLNSDTIVKSGAIDKCLEYISSHDDVGAIGCKTLLADGTLDHSCKRGLPTPEASLYYFLGLDKKHPESRKYGRYHATYLDENEINEVEVLSGAFMMLRATLIQKIGGFDEDYFMYCEDVDLCYRISQEKFKLIYFPNAEITHLKGQSGLNTKNQKVIKYFYSSMLIFYNKNFKSQYNFFVTLAVFVGIKLKLCLSLIKSFLNK
ncbi:MAG: glycosyltransferase family 2 protein [Oscillospiraceae bacterium]